MSINIFKPARGVPGKGRYFMNSKQKARKTRRTPLSVLLEEEKKRGFVKDTFLNASKVKFYNKKYYDINNIFYTFEDIAQDVYKFGRPLNSYDVQGLIDLHTGAILYYAGLQFTDNNIDAFATIISNLEKSLRQVFLAANITFTTQEYAKLLDALFHDMEIILKDKGGKQ